jgi:hypothetical protein
MNVTESDVIPLVRFKRAQINLCSTEIAHPSFIDLSVSNEHVVGKPIVSSQGYR